MWPIWACFVGVFCFWLSTAWLQPRFSTVGNGHAGISREDLQQMAKLGRLTEGKRKALSLPLDGALTGLPPPTRQDY